MIVGGAMLYRLIMVIFCFSSYLECVEMVMWHRQIGTDLTGSGVFISKLYSPDSGYDQFSLPSGVEDNNYFQIQNTDEIACSGSISEGSYTIQLAVSNGTDTYLQSVAFTVVNGKTQPRISSGLFHFLALKNNGEVYSVGIGSDGRLGRGSGANYSSLGRINSLTSQNIIDVVAGEDSSFFLCRDGRVFVTGRNNARQLGHGTSHVYTPTQNTALASEFIVAVAASASYSLTAHGGGATLFLTAQGEVFGAGKGNLGQLGLGYQASSINPPVSLQATHNILDAEFVLQISLGGDFCAILTSSNLYVAGRNDFGQLGRGSTPVSNYTLESVSFGSTISYVKAATGWTYLADSSGTLYGTGYNTSGVLGVGNTTNQTTFTALNFGYNVLDTWAVATGSATSASATIILSNGNGDFRSGANGENQLGGGITAPSSSPTAMTLPGGVTVTQAAVMSNSSIIMTSAGTLYSSGDSVYGELALGGTTSVTSYTSTGFSVGTNTLQPKIITPAMVETTLKQTSFFGISWASYELGDANLL